jgi:hypothetical protein
LPYEIDKNNLMENIKIALIYSNEYYYSGILEKLIELLREFLPQLGSLIPAIQPLLTSGPSS